MAAKRIRRHVGAAAITPAAVKESAVEQSNREYFARCRGVTETIGRLIWSTPFWKLSERSRIIVLGLIALGSETMEPVPRGVIAVLLDHAAMLLEDQEAAGFFRPPTVAEYQQALAALGDRLTRRIVLAVREPEEVR